MPGQQALENRWEWESTTSDSLPNDVHSYSQGRAFLKEWHFSEDQVFVGNVEPCFPRSGELLLFIINNLPVRTLFTVSPEGMVQLYLPSLPF